MTATSNPHLASALIAMRKAALHLDTAKAWPPYVNADQLADLASRAEAIRDELAELVKAEKEDR